MAKKTAKKSASKKKASRTHSVDDARNEIIAETVLGEMMNVTIEALKKMQMGWGAIPENQQKEIISETENYAKEQIREIVKLIASTEHKSVKVVIDHAKIKSNQVISQVSFPASDKHREEYLDFIDEQAIITLIDPEAFFGEEGKPVADPDQPALNGFE